MSIDLEADLGQHACAVLTFLEQRGLDPDEACAAMGIAISGLLRADPRSQMQFVQALLGDFGRANDKASEEDPL